MPLNRVNLVALVAILATSAISSNSSNMSVLFPITRVLAQTPETNTSQAVRLLNLCRADLNKNQYQAALQSCQLAATTAQGMGLRSTQAKSLNNLGLAYQNTGNLQQALSNYQQALVIAQAIKERALESKVLINLGKVANKLGETAKAKASFEQALRIGQQINDAQLILAAKQAQLENNPLKAEADKLIEQGNKQLDTSQFRAALGSYEQALKIYQSIKDQEGEEKALNGVGLAYDSLGDYKKAIDYHSQSLAIARALGDRLGESASLGNLGLAYYSLGDYKKAIDYQSQSLVIARAIGDRLVESQSLGNLGLAYYNLGDYKKAIDYQSQSLAIARAIGDRRGESASLGNLGNAYFSLGDYKKAIDYQSQSLAIARAIGDRLGESQSLGNLGIAYDSLGNYNKAIDYHSQRLAIARAIGDRLGESQSLGNLGIAYKNLGDYKKAIDYQSQSLVIKRAIGDRLGESHSLGNLGLAYYDLGDYKKAIDYHSQRLAIARAIGDRLGESHSLGNLGNAYDSLGDYKKAIDYYSQTLAIARAIGDRLGESQSLGNLGLAYYHLGDYNKAIDYQSQQLAIARAIGDRLGESISLNNLGVTHLDSGNPKAAEENLRGAIAVHESIRKDLQNNDAFKISIFETQAHSYRLLQQALVAQNRTLDALLIAERSRTQALIELVASRLGLSSKPVGLSIAQIQHIAQQQNATLVEYSLAWDDLYIWVIKPTGEVAFHKVELKKTKIGNLAENTRVAAATIAEGNGVANQIITGLVSKTRSSLNPTQSTSPQQNTSTPRFLDCRANECLQQMYQLLIHPIEKQLPTNPDAHVIFIPHESLFLVPFAALQDRNKQFLIEKHTISIAPSIQVLQLTHQQKVKLQSQLSAAENSVANFAKTALVVGDPIMPKVSLKIGEPPEQLPDLPGTLEEAKQVAQVLNTHALTKEQASKEAVTKLMQKASIIHLATHGLLDNLEEPGIPGAVALGGENGLLSANEVLNFKLNAQLVVLSACDTGRGRITEDSVLGFPRALITAGVPSIIVSLWQVSDNSTVFLMPEFYRQWKNNPDKARALRAAMLETMKRYPNPTDWAGFVFIGEAE